MKNMRNENDAALRMLLQMVENAIAMPSGREAVADATSYLLTLLENNKFNSARAVEVYSMTIDNIVWAHLKGKRDGRTVYRSYRSSGIRQEFGRQLTQKFTRNGAIEDQRPLRKHFRWLLGA